MPGSLPPRPSGAEPGPAGPGASAAAVLAAPPAPARAPRTREALARLAARFSARASGRLELLLFAAGAAVYLLTRLIGLTDFPIYFFCDEAIQGTLADDLLRRGFRDARGTLLPPYFQNAEKWNLSLSVYVHTLGVGLFGKTVFVTRATSVAVSLLAVVAIAWTLRRVFHSRLWWLSGLALAAIPAWFLHSRTAFETVMMVSFYACFLCAYLLYRHESPRYLYLALVFGAATFYSYANGQGVMLASGALLLLSDLRYHLRQSRRTLLAAALLAALLAIPFLRFRTLEPGALEGQLEHLHSYWILNLSLQEKVATFLRTYLEGLSPLYWYLPNSVDLDRHRMKDLGHLPLLLAPFVGIGLVVCLRQWSSSAHRAVLIALLAAPFSAALVAVSVTRALSIVVPAVLLSCIGLDQLAHLVGRRAHRVIAALAATLLGITSLGMLHAALTTGPTWYTDYGLYGMQYGAQQVFTAVPAELEKSRSTRILVSPTWANNPNVFLDFFLDRPERRRVEMMNVDAFLDAKRPLSEDLLFVMTPAEYERANASGKLRLRSPERVLSYPDGRPGFYFVRMRYVEGVDAIFAAERQARRALQESRAMLDGQPVVVRHSPLGAGRIDDLFDGTPRTLIRGLEANPLVVEIAFPTPRPVRAVALDLGSMDLSLKVTLTSPDGREAMTASETFRGLPRDPHVELALPDGGREATQARIEITMLPRREPAHVHVRELALR